jgi:hypothetical protein
MRLLCLILCVCALTACQTERTVVAGPRNVGGGASDYDSENEARARAAGQAAAASGVSGQFGSGGSAFNQRFGTFDPGGYGSDGLNAMSQQMFGGDLNSKDMKSYTQTRDFITRRFSGTRELDQKSSSSQSTMSWFSGRKANADRTARETGAEFRGSGRRVEGKTSSSDGRVAGTKTAREDGRSAQTKDYYPASKAVDEGRDAPKMIGQGSKAQNDAVWRLIKSRPRDNPATVDEIRQLLGKTE